MKQSIERFYFESGSMRELIHEVNDFTSKLSVGNVMDTTIDSRLQIVNVTKHENIHNEEKMEKEVYTYLHFAIVTVLVEE